KTGVVGERLCRIGVALSLVQVLVVAGMGYARRLPRRAGAVALDRHHDLADRLSSALSFGELSGGERTPFMLAAIDDALVHAGRVDPRRAVPMKAPAEWPFHLAMAFVITFLLLFEVRRHEPI